MSESILEITNKHGQNMYVLGLEHAIGVLEILDKDEALANLRKKLTEEKVKAATPFHSRFDLEHIKTCDDCRDAHDDFIQDSNRDAELDAASEASDNEE